MWRLIMKFYTTIVEILDRHTEPKIEDVPMGMPMPAKYEEITVSVKLTGSGDTRKFTNKEIVEIIMARTKEVEPNAI
jgi:hypothetical protein